MCVWIPGTVETGNESVGVAGYACYFPWTTTDKDVAAGTNWMTPGKDLVTRMAVRCYTGEHLSASETSLATAVVATSTCSSVMEYWGR